jgi:hypothetical protein
MSLFGKRAPDGHVPRDILNLLEPATDLVVATRY